MIDSKELIPAEKGFLPEVVDESGKKIVGPELEAVTKLVTQFAQLAQLARIRKSLEKEEYEGKIDKRTLSATDELQYVDLVNYWPHTPWISAFFINNGPDTVKIGINDPWEKMEIKKNETRTVDRKKADERIEIIYYTCDPDETASVRAEGEY